MFFRKKYNDKEIVRGFIKGDEKIFGFLEQEYRPVIKYLVINNSGTVEDAKDHYQDTLIKLLKAIEKGKFNPERGSLKAYFRTIAQGLWIDRLRERKRRISTTLIEEWHSNSIKYSVKSEVEDPIMEKLIALLVQSIKNLNEREQQLIKSRFHEGLSYKNLTILLKYSSDGYARTNMERIKKKLRKMISESKDQDIQLYLKTVNG